MHAHSKVFFFLRFMFYLKSRVTWDGEEKEEKENFPLLFTPQLAVMDGAGNFFWVFKADARAQGLEESSAAFPCLKQGTGSEMEQPGHKQIPLLGED